MPPPPDVAAVHGKIGDNLISRAWSEQCACGVEATRSRHLFKRSAAEETGYTDYMLKAIWATRAKGYRPGRTVRGAGHISKFITVIRQASQIITGK